MTNQLNTEFNNIRLDLMNYEARLVAVSKTKPVAQIHKIYDLGQRIFGENRAQEMAKKYELLPADIEWHMIGHLQSRKVKLIAPFVQMIHSIDSFKLLAEVDKQAAANNRVISILIQIKIASEDTKYGFTEADLPAFFKEVDALNPGHVVICGVMGMASFVDDEIQIAEEFATLRSVFDNLKTSRFRDNSTFREISMGMSGDYKIALQHGSTLVRIGSLIFGERN